MSGLGCIRSKEITYSQGDACLEYTIEWVATCTLYVRLTSKISAQELVRRRHLNNLCTWGLLHCIFFDFSGYCWWSTYSTGEYIPPSRVNRFIKVTLSFCLVELIFSLSRWWHFSLINLSELRQVWLHIKIISKFKGEWKIMDTLHFLFWWTKINIHEF